jgi:hypothetical protein
VRQLPTSVIHVEVSFDQDAISSSSSISIRSSGIRGNFFPRIVCSIDGVDSFGGRILHEMTTDRTFHVELSM